MFSAALLMSTGLLAGADLYCVRTENETSEATFFEYCIDRSKDTKLTKLAARTWDYFGASNDAIWLRKVVQGKEV